MRETRNFWEMTQHPFPTRERTFDRLVLPWIVCGAAFVVYVVTMGHWITPLNLSSVAEASGYMWQQRLFGPVTFLATLPFKLLPVSWVPVALNLFSAVCGALTLMLLARSVALLPYDRLPDTRRFEHTRKALLSVRTAWIAPVMAVTACGLQLGFWSHATSFSGEMLNLLMAACIIWCVLEFRYSQRNSWLFKAAFVAGACVANDWRFAALFPCFVTAAIWVRGIQFFTPGFLRGFWSMVLLGFSLIFLLPILSQFSSTSEVGSFWKAIETIGVSYNSTLRGAFSMLKMTWKEAGLSMALVSFIPLLFISKHWQVTLHLQSSASTTVTRIMFHVVHGMFLFVFAWVFSDPGFSPRFVGAGLGFSSAYLLLYYLCALCLGYFAGYFLLLFSRRTLHESTPTPSAMMDVIFRTISITVSSLLVLIAVVLVFKNLPTIRLINSAMLREYAVQSARCLPQQGAIVMSDDPVRLVLLQSHLAGNENPSLFVPLDTQALTSPAYHEYLHKQHPSLWPELPKTYSTNAEVDAIYLINTISALSSNTPVCYLHPSFGYYFEYFQAEPHGLVYSLKAYPTNTISAPPLPAAIIKENEDFWNQLDAGLLTRVRSNMEDVQNSSSFRKRIMKFMSWKREIASQEIAMSLWFSRALNQWGVTLQRSGSYPEARTAFDRALALNPDNIPAEINKACNASLLAGKRPAVDSTAKIEARMGRYRNWTQFLSDNGGLDDPMFCHAIGLVYGQGGLFRQAAQEFLRVKQLRPDFIPSRFLLCDLFSMWNMPDRVLTEIADMRSSPELQPLGKTNLAEIAFLEASACLVKSNYTKADSLIASALTSFPDNMESYDRAVGLQLSAGRIENAMSLVDRQLRLNPNRITSLINKGFILIQMNNYSNAIPFFNQALTIETNNAQAIFNRAVACLRTDQLEPAKKDYLNLLDRFPHEYKIYYGLGEIGWRQRDTNAAIEFYEGYLKYAPQDYEEYKQVQSRLAELRGKN